MRRGREGGGGGHHVNIEKRGGSLANYLAWRGALQKF